jgi:hypothetical protein
MWLVRPTRPVSLTPDFVVFNRAIGNPVTDGTFPRVVAVNVPSVPCFSGSAQESDRPPGFIGFLWKAVSQYRGRV